MAHFAQINPGDLVIDVIVVNNDAIDNLPFPESEPVGIAFCQSLYGADTVWVQTSYNASFRKNYAGIGYTWDVTNDCFIPPQPYPSWHFDYETGQWQAPIPYPSGGGAYVWDEDTLSWILVS